MNHEKPKDVYLRTENDQMTKATNVHSDQQMHLQSDHSLH